MKEQDNYQPLAFRDDEDFKKIYDKIANELGMSRSDWFRFVLRKEVRAYEKRQAA